MKINAAPLIHARTAYVDFRSAMLFVPQDWEDSKVKWARSFITASTRYFELAGTNGRRLVFSDGIHIVTGISICISDLYKLCGDTTTEYAYVDGKRTNYAFIGLVIRNEDLKSAFDIPLSVFLSVYQKYIAMRWNERQSNQGNQAWENMKVPYEMFDLSNAEEVLDIETIGGRVTRTDISIERIVQADVSTREALVAGTLSEILKGKYRFSFCSDMPNVKSIKESDFKLVTSPNADAVLKKINDESLEKTGNANLDFPRGDPFIPRGSSRSDEPNEGNFYRKHERGVVFWAVMFVVIVIAAVIIGLVLENKSSSTDVMKMISEVCILFNFYA